jgi:pimeloyl-ACP methyl ester carboxylesterase
MSSRNALRTSALSSAHALVEDDSPLLDGFGGFVDLGTLSGHHAQTPRLETEDLYGDDLIGVSISRAQSQMRSPQTPVAEKARALNLPLDYFHRILTLTEEPEPDAIKDNLEIFDPPRPLDDSLRPPALFSSHAERSASPEPMDRRTLSSASLQARSREDHDGSMTKFPDFAFDSTHRSSDGAERVTRPDGRPWNYQFPPRPTRQAPTPPTEDADPRQHRSSENDVSYLEGPESAGTPPASSHRLSLTKNILSGANRERKRTLSGSNLMANLRKLLPDLPPAHMNRSSVSLAPSGGRHSGQQSPASGTNTPTTRHSRWSMREPNQRRETTDSFTSMQSDEITTDDLASTVSRHHLDGAVESILTPTSPASNLSRARSNSEGSLFIRRRFSGTSAFDDISAFSHVTEMANSRFKAITDSIQNSNLKLPRLPRPTAKRRVSPERTNGQQSREIPGGLNAQFDSSSNKSRSTDGSNPTLARALAQTEGDLVILGGYRGSILRSAKPPHRQLWAPIKVGLNLRKVDLEVGLTREDEERSEQTVIPDGILSHIGPIDVCRRLLKQMRKCPNSVDQKLRVHNWGYDWRLSPALLSGKLIKFLESLPSNQPDAPHHKRGAVVIAHSLGGLITRHAINQRPELFAGVIFAGTPQHCVNILGPLRNGDDVLLSSTVLTAQVNFTVRTSYALLPEDGRCFIQKNTNERYDLDFFDPQVWDEYRLSPCINPPLDHKLRSIETRGKTIIGAFSDSIVASSRRASWFGGQPPAASSQGQNNGSDNLEDFFRQKGGDRVAEAASNMESSAEGMVEPSMKQTQHRPTAATTVTIPRDLAEEYLNRTLAEALAFKKELQFIPSHHETNVYPPHAFIFGRTVPTVYGAKVASKEAIKYTDAFDDLAFAAGDGVVLASAAQLPEGYRCVKGGRVESDRGHVGIMGDLDGMGRCIEAIVHARSKGVGLGKDFIRYGRGGSDVAET